MNRRPAMGGGFAYARPLASAEVHAGSPGFERCDTVPLPDEFADSAFAAEADWIFAEDARFDALRIPDHKLHPISPTDFIARFLAA